MTDGINSESYLGFMCSADHNDLCAIYPMLYNDFASCYHTYQGPHLKRMILTYLVLQEALEKEASEMRPLAAIRFWVT